MSNIFFSYSHADEALRDNLEKHLSALRHQGLIETWHDRRIDAGDEIDNRISENLERANIILLLVSADFLASSYCYGIEMTRAMERHHAGEARVIPVILRPCDWHETPFGKLLALPRDGKAVRSWPDIDDAFLNIVTGIKELLPKRAAPQKPSDFGNSIEAVRPTAGPRSSNLRVRKIFSQADKDEFLEATFEYMKNFFRDSLAELEKRNPGLTTRYRDIDNNHFSAVVYRNGNEITRCRIWLGGGFANGIAYSSNDRAGDNSLNESMNVDSDDQKLFMKPIVQFHSRETKSHFSQEGAAEYYWSILMEPLQR